MQRPEPESRAASSFLSLVTAQILSYETQTVNAAEGGSGEGVDGGVGECAGADATRSRMTGSCLGGPPTSVRAKGQIGQEAITRLFAAAVELQFTMATFSRCWRGDVWSNAEFPVQSISRWRVTRGGKMEPGWRCSLRLGLGPESRWKQTRSPDACPTGRVSCATV